jgi:hypothetical protein
LTDGAGRPTVVTNAVRRMPATSRVSRRGETVQQTASSSSTIANPS